MPTLTQMGQTRILGLVGGDPATALSGVARHLLDAVDRRFPVVNRVNFAPRGPRRLALAARTFRPSRFAWRAAFHGSLAAHRAFEHELARRTGELHCSFDLAIQVHGWAAGQPRPYTLFVDQTRLMAERGWAGWVPFAPRERSELLALERRMYDQAHHVFAMGAIARDSLTGEYDLAPDGVTVVGGGPVFDSLPPATGPGRGPAILFIGRDFERKGGESLLRAFERVRQQILTATLHIVGVERRFDIPGVISYGKINDRARLSALYRTARAFCLPSVYEPYGLVLLEAMAHGVPCVGTAVQAIPEILDHGRAGLLVEPGEPEALAEALLALLGDDTLAERTGAAGRHFLERELTWDRVVDRMAPVLAAAGR